MGTLPPIHPAAGDVPRPETWQLRAHFLNSALPMVGFGFVDNTVMLTMGHLIDVSVGAALGLSTLAAAGIGQMFSDVSGVVFGDTLGNLARGVGMRSSMLTNAQRTTRSVKAVGLTAKCVGVVLGCALGLVNLLFFEEEKELLKSTKISVTTMELGGRATVVVDGEGPEDGVVACIKSLASQNGFTIRREVDKEEACGGAGFRVVFRVAKNGRAPSKEELKSFVHEMRAACAGPALRMAARAEALEAELAEVKRERDALERPGG